MKKIILVIAFMVVALAPVPAEGLVRENYELRGQVEYDDNPIETIYLDENIDKPRVNIPQQSLTLPVGVLNITSNTNTSRSALARALVNRSRLNDILPLSAVVEERAGRITYGSRWGEELSNSQIEDTTSLFVRYDASKYLSFDTSFAQSALREIDKQYGTSKFSTEWHITDKLTLKDTFTDYLTLPKNKNEITFIYSPELKKYADSLKFELGVAQSYYTSGRQSSSVKFATGFKL